MQEPYMPSDMSDLVYLSAQELGAAIRQRRVSASEVLEAHLEQIARHNPMLNAVVTLDVDGAKRRAREADNALARGESWGPLHGVPLTVKDALETVGLRTTSGYEPLVNYVPKRDATAVARLRSAGAIVLGKTNTEKLAIGFQCENEIFGRTRNPWDPALTPGGSSGGDAAALAAGMTPLSIGSDSGGSIRIPAHYCGVYALKPTEHRVPLTGHIPELPSAIRRMRHLNTIGPLARSVPDLELALRIISGPDGQDWDVPPVPVGHAPQKAPQGMRVAWIDQVTGLRTTVDTRRALAGLAAALGDAGCRVEQCGPELDFGQAMNVYLDVFRLEQSPETRRRDTNAYSTSGEQTPATGEVEQYALALNRRDGFIQALEVFLHHWDVLICPVTVGLAFTPCPVGTPFCIEGQLVEYTRAGLGYTCPFNLTGHPVVVLPVGQSAEGLPIGVQVVGPRWREVDLLGHAIEIANVAGRFRRPPGYSPMQAHAGRLGT